MNKSALKKILEHPDLQEIITKLILDVSPKDIHDFLESKYTNVHEAKFIIAEKSIKTFKDSYLDVYSIIQEDMRKTKQAIAISTEDRLELAVKDSPAYKGKMMELASKEIDIRGMAARLCAAVETRLAQVFDEIQENPRDINTKVDRLLIEYAEMFGNILEKYYKFSEAKPDISIQNNITLQFRDQHILVLQEAIREVLSEMDLESSMLFIERLQTKMIKLKMPEKDIMPNTDVRLAEAKLLNETINKKLNQ